VKQSSFLLKLMQRSRLSWTSWSRASRERKLARAEARWRLLLTETQQQQVKVEMLRLELLPAEVRHLSLRQAKGRLEHPPIQPPPVPQPRPVEELLPRMPDPAEPPLPSAEEQLGSLLAGPSKPLQSSPNSLS
jgi:hypothetical protein